MIVVSMNMPAWYLLLKEKNILRQQHNISRARKIADGLVSHIVTIDYSHSPLVECNYDQVSFDPKRLFRFTLNAFKLKEKAQGTSWQPQVWLGW